MDITSIRGRVDQIALTKDHNMKNHIAAAQDCKDNIVSKSHDYALGAFYKRIAATNGPDHPWTLELAGIIAAHEDAAGNSDLLDGVDKIDLAVDILDDLLTLALTKCAAVDYLGEAQSAIRAARRYAGDIREQTAVIGTGAQA
jgi:hypothetical protein